MINDLKRMNVFLAAAFVLMFVFCLSLMTQLDETTDRAAELSAQVYNLGSMLGEQNAAARAKTVISEVDALD